MRFSENRDAAAVSPTNINLEEAPSSAEQGTSVNYFLLVLIHYKILPVFITVDTSATNDQSEHLKNDGTPDMRFSENRDAVTVSPTNINLEEAPSSTEQGTSVNCFVLVLIHYNILSFFYYS
jgi:hypothetical protein